MASNSQESLEGPTAVEALIRANFKSDAERMRLMSGDRTRLAWEYANSPDAHILHVFGKGALERLKPLSPLDRIKEMASLAIEAIYIKGNLEFNQKMVELDDRIDSSLARIHERADAVLEESRNRTGF